MAVTNRKNTPDIYYIMQLLGIEKVEKRINDALNSLSHEERELMKLRYYKDYTQSEVAKYLNMSQVQVSRMEKKAKEKVRTKIAS